MPRPRPSTKPNAKRNGHATRTTNAVKRGRARSNGDAGHANGNGHANGKRRTLPVVSARGQVPCLSCGLCCGYVAVEIESPNTVLGATEILWYLYHQNVSIYADDGEWMVQFETRCQHLMDDRRCAIYEQRPPICRNYDETACEVNSSVVGTSFYNPGEFLGWLAQHHKRVYAIVKKRYLPPEPSLTGQPVSTTPLLPFRPRFESLRAR